MDADLKNRLIYELKILKFKRDEYASRLDLLEPYSHYVIKCQSKNSKQYYYIKSDDSNCYNYVNRNDPRIPRIKEVAHLKVSIDQLDNNIDLVNELLEGYNPYDFQSVDFLLPRAYQSETILNTATYHIVGKKWKAEKLLIQKQFPENYPEEKTEFAADGTKVKSKNEVILYNSFLSEGFFFVYELPFPSEDYGPPLYPDFTILSPIDLKTEIIVEHVGRLDDLTYSGSFASRIRRYILNGYIPGVNLFFTFNDKDGHIDSLQISRVIADILGLR